MNIDTLLADPRYNKMGSLQIHIMHSPTKITEGQNASMMNNGITKCQLYSKKEEKKTATLEGID